MIMATSADIGKDIVLKYNGQLYIVTEFNFVNPGKGSAFYRTKMKNLESGKVMEVTFKSGENIEIAQVERHKMQYLYKDENNYYFMDPQSYEQVSIGAELMGEKGAYLKEGGEALMVLHQGVPVTAEIPKKIAFKVTEAMPGVKGDTASGNVTKEVTLEGGLKARVPLFIKEGETIIVNTDTGEYVERA
jgi:elongation factor P